MVIYAENDKKSRVFPGQFELFQEYSPFYEESNRREIGFPPVGESASRKISRGPVSPRPGENSSCSIAHPREQVKPLSSPELRAREQIDHHATRTGGVVRREPEPAVSVNHRNFAVYSPVELQSLNFHFGRKFQFHIRLAPAQQNRQRKSFSTRVFRTVNTILPL